MLGCPVYRQLLMIDSRYEPEVESPAARNHAYRQEVAAIEIGTIRSNRVYLTGAVDAPYQTVPIATTGVAAYDDDVVPQRAHLH